MTLKEKLEVEIMDLPIMDEVVEDIAKNLEYVADEFAIEFAAWVANRIRYDNAKLYFRHSAKELLEIYKQEKGL